MATLTLSQNVGFVRRPHGLTNARGLSGAEIAALDLRTRETRNTRVRRERTAVTPSDDEDDDENDDEEGVTTVLDTPRRPITLALRSPEAPPPLSQAPSPPELMTVSRSFPEGPFIPLASTAPPKTCRRRGPARAEASAHTRALQRCSCAG